MCMLLLAFPAWSQSIHLGAEEMERLRSAPPVDCPGIILRIDRVSRDYALDGIEAGLLKGACGVNHFPNNFCTDAFNQVCDDPRYGGSGDCHPGTDHGDCVGLPLLGGTIQPGEFEDEETTETPLSPEGLSVLREVLRLSNR